jgi:hypothetical protein
MSNIECGLKPSPAEVSAAAICHHTTGMRLVALIPSGAHFHLDNQNVHCPTPLSWFVPLVLSA